MHRLIQDQDCHWYLILDEEIQDFYKWCDSHDPANFNPELLHDVELPNFNSKRINGPHNVLIKEYEIA